MRIDINLASLPYEDSRRFWTYWGTGLALLALTTALLGFLAVTGFINASRDRHVIVDLESRLAASDQEKNRAEAMLNHPGCDAGHGGRPPRSLDYADESPVKTAKYIKLQQFSRQ